MLLITSKVYPLAVTAPPKDACSDPASILKKLALVSLSTLKSVSAPSSLKTVSEALSSNLSTPAVAILKVSAAELKIPVFKSSLNAKAGVLAETSSRVYVPSSWKSSTQSSFAEFLIFNVALLVSAHNI